MRWNRLVFAVVPIVITGVAQAGFIDPNFSGTTDFDAWDNLTVTNPQVASSVGSPFPGFSNSSSPWPAPIESALHQESNGNVVVTDPTGDATFDKTGGTGYPAQASIYNSFGIGTYTVADATPVTGLETVFFQIELGGGFANFFNPPQIPGFFALPEEANQPVLNYNGGTQELAPIFTDSFEGPTPFAAPPIPGVDPGDASGTTTIFAFQWDLTGVEPITDYSIEWSGIEFGTTYALQLNTSDTFALVPEPASALLVGLGALVMCGRRRRS